MYEKLLSIITLAVTVALTVLVSVSVSVSAGSCSLASSERVDCGYVGLNEGECLSRGCCWLEAPSPTPWCYYEAGQAPVYTITNITTDNTNNYAILMETQNRQGQYQLMSSTVLCTVLIVTNGPIRIQFSDPNNSNRWTIPESIIPINLNPNTAALSSPVTVSINPIGKPFQLNITRTIDNTILFSTSTVDLQYSDQFLQLTNKLPIDTTASPLIYGLGERIDNLQLSSNNHYYTLFAIDAGTALDQNLYSSHPFYLQLLSSGLAHGLYLHNSNGMDIILNKNKITYRTIGGIFDFFLFTGITPESVTQQYHSLIGFTHLPPYWSLGWHQSRWGYTTLSELQSVINGYQSAEIPLDTLWSDIDYMSIHEDFTYDSNRFPTQQYQQFIQSIHNSGMKYVVIIDPGIHNRTGYSAYESGLSANIFITESDGITPYIGEVWPGSTAFPDFTNPNIDQYWGGLIKNFIESVSIDGLWIDMNEISNFINGDGTSSSVYNNPPYLINNNNNNSPLNYKTLPMDAVLYNNNFEYNLHNLYGLTEAKTTRTVLESITGARGFILSRSSFPSSGRYTAKWSGDNVSTFEAMAESIVSILTMNLFGIPFAGADICGFNGNTTEELCNRWMALGAFYPFSRNHNTIGAMSQEPYLWESVTKTAKIVIAARYSLLPYLYTLFWNSNQNGGTVARPLFFEFPTDSQTWAIQEQYLLGNSIMISPVLTQGATTVDVYFTPQSIWYEYWTGYIQQYSGYQTLQTPINHIQVHIRGGIIIPNQFPALTTTTTRLNPFYLIIALDNNESAIGSLYWDNGIDLDIGKSAINIDYTVSEHSRKLTNNILFNTYTNNNPIPILSTIKIWGLKSGAPSNETVTVNGEFYNNFVWDNLNYILIINELELIMQSEFTITW